VIRDSGRLSLATCHLQTCNLLSHSSNTAMTSTSTRTSGLPNPATISPVWGGRWAWNADAADLRGFFREQNLFYQFYPLNLAQSAFYSESCG
jgi:hypothetical protein